MMQATIPPAQLAELAAQIKQAPDLARKAIRKAGRAKMLDVVESARRLLAQRDAVKSGTLAESLGVMTRRDSEGMTFMVGPRRDFRFRKRIRGIRTTDYGYRQGKRMAVYSSTARRKKAIAQGYRLMAAPARYGYGIETGRTRSGKMARKAGPVHYLRDGLRAHEQRITQTLAHEVSKALGKLKEKGG